MELFGLYTSYMSPATQWRAIFTSFGPGVIHHRRPKKRHEHVSEEGVMPPIEVTPIHSLTAPVHGVIFSK